MHGVQEENGKLKASNDDLTVRLQEVGSQADAERNGPDLKVCIKVLTPLTKGCGLTPSHHLQQYFAKPCKEC